MSNQTRKYIKISLVFIGILLFYSYIHKRAYEMMFSDTVFHGIPYSKDLQPLSHGYHSVISEGFHQIIERNEKMRKNKEASCCQVEMRFELNKRKMEHRSIIIYTISYNTSNTVCRYFYSPEKKKIWHRETLHRERAISDRFISNERISILDSLLVEMFDEKINNVIAFSDRADGKALFILKFEQSGLTSFNKLSKICPVSDDSIPDIDCIESFDRFEF